MTDIIRGQEFSFEISLIDALGIDGYRLNPSFVSGDVKISKDGGSLFNINSLPVAISGSSVVTVVLTATEMDADRVVVVFKDQDGEWKDYTTHTIFTNQEYAKQATLEDVEVKIEDFSVEALADLATIIAATQSLPSIGSGARTVIINVMEALPLEHARVRLTMGLETYLGYTDGDGDATFNLDDGTYTVAITLSEYEFAGATLVVNSDTNETYVMSKQSVDPSDPGLTTGYMIVYDEYGIPEQGAAITSFVKHTPESLYGVALDTLPRTIISDANGLVEFVNMFKTVTYTFKRGISRAFNVTIPQSAGDTYELPSIYGKD